MRKDWRNNLEWQGDDLCQPGRETPIVSIVPDEKYPLMWRIRYPDGSLSDMVNKSRARDAARSIAASILEVRETASISPLAA
jgi:hypothetical protein